MIHEKEETWIDKSSWPNGPWKLEPDRKEWRYRDYVCLMLRVEHHGSWCGYVGVPPGHPWHGQNYNDLGVEVHGGLTYSDTCQVENERPKCARICHEPELGEPDNVWWLGFDTAHAFDFNPGRYVLYEKLGIPNTRMMEEVYRDAEYVENQVAKLVAQAEKAEL